VSDVVARVDGFQRRRRVVGFPIGVLYKFFDDQGAYLATILTYYAFVAIFPLLLIASSVLGFVLEGNEQLQEEVLDSALSQFPIVGTQIGKPEGLTGSTSAVVIGSLAAFYGVLGLGQAAQNAVNVVWAVPRNSRLNPVVSRLHSVVMLVLAGSAVLAVTVASSVLTNLEAFGPDLDAWVKWLTIAASVAINAITMAVLIRLATSRRPTLRSTLPGAVAIALMWQALQTLGSAYVTRVIARVSDMNGVFAVVLGLIALLYLACVMGVIGLEINVVLAQRLYPRALLTPFTDAVDLTDADRRAYTAYAQAQRHKGFERVDVSFRPRHRDERDDGADAAASPTAPFAEEPAESTERS
jgi:YihY family inner membrane protein